MRKGRFAGLVRGAEDEPQGDPRAAGFVALFEGSGQGWFWQTDALGHIAYLSPALTAQPEGARAVAGKNFAGLWAADEPAAADQSLAFHLDARTSFNGIAVRAVAGEAAWLVSGEPQFDEIGRFLGFQGLGIPLTADRREDADAARRARFDSLTGLPNRAHIEELLDEALANSDRRKQSCGLFLIDLDRFKQVNDTLGHPAGDALLQQVAERLGAVIGADGQAGRIGGDEFEAVFPGIGEEGRLAGIADRLIRALSEPYLIHGQHVSIGASVGIAISRPGRTYRQALIKEADLALYAAKRAGRGTLRFFEPEMDAEESQRKILESDLRTAVAKGQLKLLYQPIIAVSTEALVGFEALVRWWHPTRGPLAPGDFLPIAAASGQMATLGEWIVRTACTEATAWPSHLRLAINLGIDQLGNGCAAVVIGALAASGLAPGRLDVEVCEDVLLTSDPAILETLLALHGLGVGLVLDDFGLGAASLASLSAAPLDRIKLHADFLRAAQPAKGRPRAVAGALLKLAESLGIGVVAEGAETLDDLQLIRALGCDEVQGFLFARPLDSAEACALAADSRAVDPKEREGQRAPRHSLIRIGTLHAAGADWPVRLRNISVGGAMLESPREVAPDAAVELELDGKVRLRATIRWCHDGRIGLQFAEAFDFARLGKAPKRSPEPAPGFTPDYLKQMPKPAKITIRNVRGR